MSEKTVVVVGSSASAGEYATNYFGVIDFSNVPAQAPSTVQLALPFSNSGSVVDCSGSMAVVANSTGPGSSITIYDISTPAEPRSIGSVGALPFNGIGAISFYAGYILAAEAGGRRVALIEIGSLASPTVYETGLDTLTDVAVFGEYAVFCGTSVYQNAFQVASLSNLSSLQYGASTSFSPAAEYAPAVTCDFDGTHAVFSDGSGVYIFGISSGTPTVNPVAPSGPGLGTITSVAIAEGQSGGVLTAYAGAATYFNLSFVFPVTPEANPDTKGPSLGEPGLPGGGLMADYAGIVSFNRTIYGTSTMLAAAGVTENASMVQEYVVSLYNVSTVISGGTGSLTESRVGQRATVQLPAPPDTMLATLGITTFDTFTITHPLHRPYPYPIGEL